MTGKFLKWFLWVWAIVGAPMLFAAFDWSSYWYALSKGRLPYTIFPNWEWLWFFIFGFCLISGVIASFMALRCKIWIRVIAGIIYSVAMTAIMIFLGLTIACGWDDCL